MFLTRKKITQLPHKITALLLAVVMAVSMLPTVAFAESGQIYNVGADVDLSFVSQTYIVDGDIGGLAECGDAITDGLNVYVTEYSGADPYGIATMASVTGTISTGNSYGYNSAWLTEFSPYTSCDIKYFNGQPAYCIEPHKGTANGQSVSASSYLGNKELMLALAYGYGGVDDSTLLYYSNFGDYAWLATQEVIWEIVGGYSDLSDLFIGPNHSYDASVAVPIKNAHDYIWDCINQQHKRPIFAVAHPNNSSKDIELSWNGSTWTATVTDTNYVLPNFDTFRFALSGVTTSRSGYKLTITATPEAAKSMTSGLASQRSEANFIDPDDINAYLLTPTSSGAQDCVALNGWPDPVYAYIRAKVTQTTGDLTIVKTSEDGKVSGVSFTITGPNSYSKTATTNAQGKISLTDLQPGTYTVKENAVSYYVAPASQNVSVSIGDTKTVTFNNTLKRGTLRVTKTSEDGIVAGHTFKLTGTSTSGQSVDMTAPTNSSGIATFSNVPIGTNYRLEEVNTAAKYVVPSVQTGVSVTYGGTTNKYFYNSLARGDLAITKTSEDNIVAGMKFRLTGTSLSGTPIDETATTDANGVAHFSNILIGSNYKVEEINTPIRYVVPAVQEGVVIPVNNDPLADNDNTARLQFYNKLARGSVEVTKTSEDGDVAGVKFHLSGTAINGDTVDVQAVTNAQGIALFENILIGNNYTIEEVDTAEKYIVPAVVENVRITLNETTPVSMRNVLKRGHLQVTKNSEDGLVEGISFRLTGLSLSGAPVDETAQTNAQGIALFRDILIGSNYSLQEVDTAIKYVIPTVQSDIDITYNVTADTEMTNVLKKWKVTVIKRDAETGATPQGDGTFEGAVYGLYKDGELVKQYTIGADGTFTTDEYVCNDGYTIKEDTAPLGYKLDPTEYPVGSGARNYTIEHNTAPDITSSEQIKHGTFSITKIVSAVPGLVQRFEVGAVFQYYLKSAGSYENARDSERGILTTNADGETGKSISLPYGTYVVHQTQSAVGVKPAPDFTVLIGDKPDGTNKLLVVYNEPIAGYIRVVKVDADDDEVIPWSGAKFEIYDPSGEKITQQVTYPSVQNISVFETNYDGYFITPLMLPYGVGYKLVEVGAPKGYELSETPIYFDVTPDTIEADDVTGLEYVHVTFSDEAAPPTVDTVAVGINGGKKILPTTDMTIIDTVDCSGVIPGKSYTVKGWLVLKSTGLPLLDADGEQITASETFTADQDFSGQVELRFTLDATKLTNDAVVVFDELYRGEKLVATHTDIENEDQTVEVRRRPYYKTEEKPELSSTGDAGLDGYILAVLFSLEGCVVMFRRRKRD